MAASFSRASRRRPVDFRVIDILGNGAVLQARKLRDLRHLAADVALVFDGDLHALGECGREGAAARIKIAQVVIGELRRRSSAMSELPSCTSAVPREVNSALSASDEGTPCARGA